MQPLNYDPNIRTAVHVIEVTLCQWDYSGTFRYEIGGNCKGCFVMDDPGGSLLDAWYCAHEKGEEIEDVEVVDNEFVVVTLQNPNGETLECEIYDESDIEHMIVGVRIVEVRPENA